MHMVIRIVVEANDVQSAVKNAKSWFNENLRYDNGGLFDYCQPMVESGDIFGADRWADYQGEPPAYPLASDDGREEVESAWESTVGYMEDNLEAVWETVQDADDFEDFAETILNEDYLVRHKMNKVAGYQSTEYFLYVQGWNTGGVRSERGWEYLQERIVEDTADADDAQWWVVPLDVHH